MSLVPPNNVCPVCDGFLNVPASYKGSGRCRCEEIARRDAERRKAKP